MKFSLSQTSVTMSIENREGMWLRVELYGNGKTIVSYCQQEELLKLLHIEILPSRYDRK